MKRTSFLLLLVLLVLMLSACSSSNVEPGETDLEAVAVSEKVSSTSPYVRQRWAQDLEAADLARIELLCNDKELPYACYTGEDLGPLVEQINAIDGKFVPEAIVSGRTEDIYPSTLYVFAQDDSRYLVQKIAGDGCNYIAIDGSIFFCDDALFDQFPEVGTGPFPEDHTIGEGKRPQEEVPPEQISIVTNIAPETPDLPVPQGYETYDWMVNLKAEDVDFIEYISPMDPEKPYRRYEGEDIQEIIDLFGANLCYEYSPAVQWQGFFNEEFHIILKDGTTHTVASIGTVETVIDGAAFSTISEWIIGWPETGNASLPEDWAEQVASRNYNICEAEKSTMSTDVYQADRASLDHRYNTDPEMGSLSRNYPIGRGVVELYGENATPTGLTLKAYWNNSPLSAASLGTKPTYWLERWEEDKSTGFQGYLPIQSQDSIPGPAQEMVSRDFVQWNVSWEDVCGTLEPGYYRLGMTFYETQNGAEQNETICYAKFSIS